MVMTSTHHCCEVVAIEVVLLFTNPNQVVADVSVSTQDGVAAGSNPVKHLQGKIKSLNMTSYLHVRRLRMN